MSREIIESVRAALSGLGELPLGEQINVLNEIRAILGQHSPFQAEPVDVVKWVPADMVVANEYNPNKVAPPEMRLLEVSIEQDGYTQPIVAYWDESNEWYIVIDGFHRYRIGQEHEGIRERVRGHLPIVVIDKPITERMASTIRHNRARGTHAVEPMSKLVEALYFAGWSDRRIGRELGMDRDEVLRLKQFSGLGALFRGRKFSEAWEVPEFPPETDELPDESPDLEEPIGVVAVSKGQGTLDSIFGGSECE